MNAMKSLLVGAAACAAVAAAPAVVSLPKRDAHPDSANSDATTNLKTMMLHGDRVAYRDEGTGRVVNNWPGFMVEYVRATRALRPEEFREVRPLERAA